MFLVLSAYMHLSKSLKVNGTLTRRSRALGAYRSEPASVGPSQRWSTLETARWARSSSLASLSSGASECPRLDPNRNRHPARHCFGLSAAKPGHSGLVFFAALCQAVPGWEGAWPSAQGLSGSSVELSRLASCFAALVWLARLKCTPQETRSLPVIRHLPGLPARL